MPGWKAESGVAYCEVFFREMMEKMREREVIEEGTRASSDYSSKYQPSLRASSRARGLFLFCFVLFFGGGRWRKRSEGSSRSFPSTHPLPSPPKKPKPRARELACRLRSAKREIGVTGLRYSNVRVLGVLIVLLSRVF